MCQQYEKAVKTVLNYLVKQGYSGPPRRQFRQAAREFRRYLETVPLGYSRAAAQNSLFFKTQRGANVGDLYMSLIYTCMLCRANPVEYLTELERHASELAENPDKWLPWNYQDHLSANRAVPR